MPVEFLTDDEAAAYGRYAGAPSQADLERVFFLDDDDRALVDRHRGEHMRAGADLPGADLTGADLPGADLTGADLTGAWRTPGEVVPEGWQLDNTGRLVRRGTNPGGPGPTTAG